MRRDNPWISYVLAASGSIIVLLVGFFGFCIAINIHNPGLWILAAAASFVFVLITKLFREKDYTQWRFSDAGFQLRETISQAVGASIGYAVPVVLLLIAGLGGIFGGTLFNAGKYADILAVSHSDFSTDLAETMDTDSVALMDTASARKLGDREIGSLSDVVSQFNVSYGYTQIDFNGKPLKVSALKYAGFFKWLNNKDAGAPGYVTVDPVSMTASFEPSEGMRYIPSAYFFENAERHLWMKHPTLMLENLHFEIDEKGKPYYIASVVEKTIGLFGGKTVSGCVVLDPVTGDTVRYSADEVPQWVDVVFDGDLICEQYNWLGLYSNGYFNSIFAKKDCRQVTTYYGEESDDYAAGVDYGYISKDGDIWIYTGVTSVNGDSSNIGFLLANQRTGESRYYPVAGADEKSAMMAAQGEVQEKRYQASFPSLINVEGNPTYIMVLKDSGGLVKLYAAVNVEQYNLVTTAATQSECIAAYKALLGMNGVSDSPGEPEEITITIASVRDIVIDGNTYFYLVDTEDNIFRAKASAHEDMLLLKKGDKIVITCSGSTITGWRKAE